jgi:predicted Zn-dependent protease
MFKKLIPLILALTFQVTGCAVNPVTGERNFQIYGTDWEQQVGAEMYAPLKQSQGGDFIIDPELTVYVQSVGERLAEQARRKEQLDFEFSVLNDSTPNAWALPGGKIVVNRGLLTELGSEAELAAVLGHEIVHADAAHGARAQSKGMLTQIGAIATMVVLGSTIDNEAAREIGMMVPLVGAQLLTQKYGRDAERESDHYGMLYMSEAGYDPQGAVELQETFVTLSEGRNEDWLSGLFASHPPSRERVRNNIETAQNLPPGGEMGRERYREATAFLRRVEPAYAAFDEANEAVSDENLSLAQKKLNEAMAIEPRESLFHALQGDIYALREDYSRALRSYRKAVDANPDLFYGYLRQGQVEYKLNEFVNARRDLTRSMELLPTAEAHYLLGMMDKSEGRMESALEHFRAAAESGSPAGENAGRELILIDLPSNPSRYIESRAAVDNTNTVWVQFGNMTSVPMENIQISYAWLDDQGRTREGRTSYRGPLKAREQGQIKLGIRLNDADELNQRVRVEVTGATVAE